MRIFRSDTIEEAEEKCFKYVQQGRGREKRPLLYCMPKHSYDDKGYKMEFWVIQGSPMQGVIIKDSYRKTFVFINGELKKEAEFRVEERF